MNSKGFWIALGVAAAGGAIVAALYAPGGEKRRKKLAEAYGEAGEYVNDAADYLKDRAERLAHEAETVYKQTAAAAVDAYQSNAAAVNEVVSGAVKAAGNALEDYAKSASAVAGKSKSML